MTLRTRIILGNILLVAVSFTFILNLIMDDVRPRYLQAVEESVVDTSELLAAVLGQKIVDGTLHTGNIEAAMDSLSRRSFSAVIRKAAKRKTDLLVYITDKNGIVLYDSSGQAAPGADYSQWRDVYLTLRGRYGARSTRRVPDDPSSSVLYVAAPIMAGGQLFGVVTVGKPQDSVSFFISIARNRLRLVLILSGIAAVALAVALSLWVTWPIKRLITYVNAVRQGEQTRMPDLGRSEIGVLGQAIGDMQSKLEGKSYIEDYVRALTHEMKSPLTGIKGAGEILRDHVTDPRGAKFLDNIDSEVDRMQSLVERMLLLSRLENARSVSAARINADVFFQDVAESFHPALLGKKLRLDLDVPPGLVMHGDAFLLRQALDNLVANAVDFSPQGTTIAITARKHGRNVLISVRDQGTGMPDFALAKAFDKFFSLSRPDTGKKSTGLGLPFVKEVAALHNGSVELRNASPGLEVTLMLPDEL